MKYYSFKVRRGDVSAWHDYVLPSIRKECRSYPNGSAYTAEVIRGAIPGITRRILEEESIGPGVEFHPYFGNRDRIITAVEVTVMVPETPEELEELAEIKGE